MPMPRRQATEATISKDSRSMSSKKQRAAQSDAHLSSKGGGSSSSSTAPVSFSASSSTGQLDLQVIDDAYGKTADLYKDVLQVSTSATQEAIQLAYFDRRSELFTLLAKIDARPQSETMVAQRYKAERKMDSVVLAVRILGDPALRVAYDRLRPERLQRQRPAASRSTSSSNRRQAAQASSSAPIAAPTAAAAVAPAVVTPTAADETLVSKKVVAPAPAVVSPSSNTRERRRTKEARTTSPPSLRKDRNKKTTAAVPNDDTLVSQGSTVSESSENLTDEDLPRGGTKGRRTIRRGESAPAIEENSTMESRQEDDSRTNAETVDTTSTAEKDAVKKGSGVFSCFTASRTLKAITDEISGACEDTLVSVDQVFNAFTLTDKDIKAVTKKIDKAKRQLDS